MVASKSKDTKKVPKNNEKITNTVSGDVLDDKELTAELEKTHEAFNEGKQKTDLKAIKTTNSNKDQTSKKVINLKKVYKYWVIIHKDGIMINNFGVREDTVAGIKMLIRTEKVGREEKVIFKELYPEPRFDVATIANNKHTIKKELNKLLQIKKILEDNFFKNTGKTIDYNFDLSDVNNQILVREIELHSVQYGKTFRYTFDIRDDGIPCLIYDLENNGLKLKKEVKEKMLITQASEVKRLESHDINKQIDEELNKKNDKNWQKLLFTALHIIFLIVNMTAAFQFMAYNEDRSYEDTKQKLEDLMDSQANGLEKIMDAATNQFDVDNSAELNALLKSNQDILDKCIDNKMNSILKPTVE